MAKQILSFISIESNEYLEPAIAAPISRPLAMQMLVRINLDPPTPEMSSVFLRDRDVVAQVAHFEREI